MFQILGKPWVWKDINTEGVQFSEWDTMVRISGQILHLWGICGSQPVAEHNQLQDLGEKEIQEPRRLSSQAWSNKLGPILG